MSKFLRYAALLSTVVVGSAWANTINVTCTALGPTATDVTNANIVCPQFNNTLGTLTSIAITVSGSETATVEMTNNNGTTNNSEFGLFMSSAAIGSAGLAGFAFPSPLFSFVLDSPTATNAAPGSVVTFTNITTPTGTGSNGPVTDTTILAPYQSAAPGTFNVPITTSTAFGLVVDPVGNAPLTSSAGSSDLLSANANVTFTYTPTGVVPEPSTAIFFGAGLIFLLIGIGKRRRRNA